MTTDEVIRVIRDHLEDAFPKVCTTCGREFATLRDYIKHTTPVGATLSLDASEGDWAPTHPIGTFALANCSCGSTLALTTDGLPQATRRAMLGWLQAETERLGVTPDVVLGRVREEIRARVLTAPD